MSDLTTRAAIKAIFQTGDPLNQAAFIDLIDSVPINTEVAAKAPLASPTFTGNLNMPATTGASVGLLKIGDTRTHTFFPTGGDPIWGRNLFLGDNAGNFTMATSVPTPEQGISHIGIGWNSLSSLTTGYRNIAIGDNTLRDTTTGFHNVAVGHGALVFNTIGQYNTACGQSPLFTNTTGSNNTACGADALFYNTTGSRNNAFGRNALWKNTTGDDNAAFGHEALFENTTGYYNAAFGFNALNANTTGFRNSAFGVACLRAVTTGDYNVGFGDSAGVSITTGNNNLCLGTNSVAGLTTGSNNVGIGACTFASGDQNNVVLADGLGNRRLSFDSSGVGTFPGIVVFDTVIRLGAPLRDAANGDRIKFLASAATEIYSGNDTLIGYNSSGSYVYDISSTRALFRAVSTAGTGTFTGGVLVGSTTLDTALNVVGGTVYDAATTGSLAAQVRIGKSGEAGGIAFARSSDGLYTTSIGISGTTLRLTNSNGSGDIALVSNGGTITTNVPLQLSNTAVAATPTPTHTITLKDATGTTYRIPCVV